MEAKPEIPQGPLFRIQAILWLFPSLGATYLLWKGKAAWIKDQGILSWLTSVRIEEWIAVSILILHVVFIWRWNKEVRRKRGAAP